MAVCKYCGAVFQWGKVGEKFVPLIPIGEEGDLVREFHDVNGEFRSAHSLICTRERAGPAIRVERLAVPMEADQLLPVGEHLAKIMAKKAQKAVKRRAKGDPKLDAAELLRKMKGTS